MRSGEIHKILIAKKIVISFTRDITLVRNELKYSLDRYLDDHVYRFDDITV